MYCPDRDELLAWISDNPTRASRREIAKAFSVKGGARLQFRRRLRELEEEGHLTVHGSDHRSLDRLPPVSVLQVTGPDSNGDLTARPLEWHGEDPDPAILVLPGSSGPALASGDRILARLTGIPGEGYRYEARVMRKLGDGSRRLIGILRKRADGCAILPVAKSESTEWTVAAAERNGARDGELVEAEICSSKGRLRQARVVSRLGNSGAPGAFSLIAVHQHGIPLEFPQAAMKEAEQAKPAGLGNREDLRHLPFITIDPPDARDHDDACFAQADDDPHNPGGHVIWVAIADVSHYVRSGSALDSEAYKRGNSTYFPDRVVPMLPNRLSGELCSLQQGLSRPCLAVCMRIDAQGNRLSMRFVRGLMRSEASLTYSEVQQAIEGKSGVRAAPLLREVIEPLYAAYGSLCVARGKRQPLEIDLPEREIVLDGQGRVLSVDFRERLDSHRLIEEFMILANVAAAEILLAKRSSLLFRVHEEPDPAKLDALRETAGAAGYSLAKGQVAHTRHLNSLLKASVGTENAELIAVSTLRAMAQANYSARNLGHFGLALANYTHFTSPIRRYADLVVHRALIAAHGWGADGLSQQEDRVLEQTGKHISETERRSMVAERDTMDRYLAAYLSERVGSEFSGRISGVARFGAFVRLDGTGADGMVPIRLLGREYFRCDPDAGTLTGTETGTVVAVGQRATVRLVRAVPRTGGLELEILSIGGRRLLSRNFVSRKPQSSGGRRSSGHRKGKHRETRRRV